MQGPLPFVAAAAVVLTAVSAAADRRRQRRRNIEAVGLMPWPLITVISVMIAMFATALAIKDAGG